MAQMAAIVESTEAAILSKDLNGIIASWNPGAEKLFGYRAEEVIGKPVTILIPPDRVEEEPRILERLRRGEVIPQASFNVHHGPVSWAPQRDHRRFQRRGRLIHYSEARNR
jgi:PAS domain S-box-containing protein